MRLWSIHPKYLDRQGLITLWREGLLAKKVLEGKTKGYKKHPQLERFKNTKDPVSAINIYLKDVLEEAIKRNYNFDAEKITPTRKKIIIPVNSGQIKFELRHLLWKLRKRDLDRYEKYKNTRVVKPHPIIEKRMGEIESWEKV